MLWLGFYARSDIHIYTYACRIIHVYSNHVCLAVKIAKKIIREYMYVVGIQGGRGTLVNPPPPP